MSGILAQSGLSESSSYPQQYSHVHFDEYKQENIDIRQYAKVRTPNPLKSTFGYIKSLFPILGWIGHYPVTPNWVYSDFVAGVTVAIVLVPQSMSYAQIATLDPQYGLYSSFVGVLIYAFFATSKDVSIGPVAVMSMEVGKIIVDIQDKHGDKYSAPVIATTLSLLCGACALGIGLLRLGFLLELIPLPAVLAFMSGSSLNIVSGQVPALMGFNKHVNTRDATYKIIINTLKNLHRTKVDAAFGLVCLFILYIWKYSTDFLYKRYPRQRVFFYLQHLRTAIVIIFATLISFLIIRHDKKHSPFSVIGEVPSGLKNTGVMKLPPGLASDIAPHLPVSTIILLLEHISIAKSFGRINDYKINPNQELIAIGVTNLVGTFFNSYPATGSFSRTALKAKTGVRTPFAGVFTGASVLLAIYCFTDAFFYIPKAALSAIIIHCVADLLSSYKITWNLWRVNPLDWLIFIVGVFICVFSTIENGIYFAVACSGAVLIWRQCIPNGTFLGRVKVFEVVDPQVASAPSIPETKEQSSISSRGTNKKAISSTITKEVNSTTEYQYHYAWVPLPRDYDPNPIHTDYVNDRVVIEPPPPGVFVFRPTEAFVYPNSARQTEVIVDIIKQETQAASVSHEKTFNRPGKLNWSFKTLFNKKGEAGIVEETPEYVEPKPRFKLLHLDFSQVIGVDTTSVQALIDLKRALEFHAGTDFEIHFSGILSPWVRRGLVNAGFGGDIDPEEEADSEHEHESIDEFDPEKAVKTGTLTRRVLNGSFDEEGQVVPIVGTNYPNFHFEIPSFSNYE